MLQHNRGLCSSCQALLLITLLQHTVTHTSTHTITQCIVTCTTYSKTHALVLPCTSTQCFSSHTRTHPQTHLYSYSYTWIHIDVGIRGVDTHLSRVYTPTRVNIGAFNEPGHGAQTHRHTHPLPDERVYFVFENWQLPVFARPRHWRCCEYLTRSRCNTLHHTATHNEWRFRECFSPSYSLVLSRSLSPFAVVSTRFFFLFRTVWQGPFFLSSGTFF